MSHHVNNKQHKMVAIKSEMEIHDMVIKQSCVAIGVAMVVGCGSAWADELDDQLDVLDKEVSQLERLNFRQIYSGSPGSSSGAPSAYGASWGSFGFGVGVQERTRGSSKTDGGGGLSIGFGNAQALVGINVAVSITDFLNDERDGPGFEGGTAGLKIHRSLGDHGALGKNAAVALGVDNLFEFGRQSDIDETYYLVYSNKINFAGSVDQPFTRLFYSFGIGNGRFQTERQVREDTDTVGLFGSVGTNIIAPLNAFVEWTGQNANLGFSLVPLREYPLTLTFSIVDLFQTAGDGARLSLGVGYGFSF